MGNGAGLLGAVLASVAAATPAIANPAAGGSGGNTLIPFGPNFLTISQSVEDLGGGVWEYTYSFTNDDPSAIWHLLLYSAFHTFSATSTGFQFNTHHRSSSPMRRWPRGTQVEDPAPPVRWRWLQPSDTRSRSPLRPLR